MMLKSGGSGMALGTEALTESCTVVFAIKAHITVIQVKPVGDGLYQESRGWNHTTENVRRIGGIGSIAQVLVHLRHVSLFECEINRHIRNVRLCQ